MPDVRAALLEWLGLKDEHPAPRDSSQCGVDGTPARDGAPGALRGRFQ